MENPKWGGSKRSHNTIRAKFPLTLKTTLFREAGGTSRWSTWKQMWSNECSCFRVQDALETDDTSSFSWGERTRTPPRPAEQVPGDGPQ